MGLDSNETQDFDSELLFILAMDAKTSGTSPKPLPFIYGFFPKGQSSQHVGNDLRPSIQGVKVGY
jgi:hypothetical protein